MKAFSGVLIMRTDSRRGGRTTIDFDNFSVTGDATLAQGRQVGRTGRFRNLPAFIVNFREYTLQDDTRGRSERDEYVLNTICDQNRLVVEWNIGDDADVFEIGFLVTGE